jgi:hypothetical protein
MLLEKRTLCKKRGLLYSYWLPGTNRICTSDLASFADRSFVFVCGKSNLEWSGCGQPQPIVFRFQLPSTDLESIVAGMLLAREPRDGFGM